MGTVIQMLLTYLFFFIKNICIQLFYEMGWGPEWIDKGIHFIHQQFL